ncbi:MAG: transferase hexapeptide repeat family protein [Alphaproteobacteria bacterium]|nr:transferase hexapeptide repeat family protein [Alphaproteobacteria bacterium]
MDLPHIYAYDDVVPVIDDTAFVHPSAVIIGDVIIGAGVYVGPSCVLRGDFGRLILEEGSNFQDTCVAHSFPDMEMVVRKNGHIGHGAVLHGCEVGENALVGMNAVIMDGAKLGKNSIVAAMAFVKANFELPDNHLAVGSPAKVLRELSAQEIAWKSDGTQVYQQLAKDSFEKMRPTKPLRQIEENRRHVRAPKAQPLHVTKTALPE